MAGKKKTSGVNMPIVPKPLAPKAPAVKPATPPGQAKKTAGLQSANTLAPGAVKKGPGYPAYSTPTTPGGSPVRIQPYPYTMETMYEKQVRLNTEAAKKRRR